MHVQALQLYMVHVHSCMCCLHVNDMRRMDPSHGVSCLVQVPASFFPRLQPIASLLGGIICLASLAGYCAYQVPCSLLPAEPPHSRHRRHFFGMPSGCNLVVEAALSRGFDINRSL